MYASRVGALARASILLLAVVGCGGGAATLDGGMDATSDARVDAPIANDAGADATESDAFVPGPHGAFPQAINGGGGVLGAPVVVPVFFAGDALEPNLEAFLAALASSSYWSTLESQYGVGPLTVAPSVVLDDTPPETASIDDVADFIAAKLEASASDAGDAGGDADDGDGGDDGEASAASHWPAPTPNTVYFMYYPASTTLTLGASVGCDGFAGYHSNWHTATNQTYVFAAQARCPNLQTLDVATQNTTHELVESTTDPLFTTYASVDVAHAIWSADPGYELGDLCEVESLSYQRMIGNSLVARFWSNTAAAQGHDPCAPAIADVYYNSVPVLPDQVSITLFSQPVTTDGVSVPLHQSKTIAVQLFSDAPTTDWSLQAQDLSSSGSELAFTWDDTTGNNGDTRQLTITRAQNDANGGTEFVIYSQQSSSSWHAYFAVAGQ